MGVLAGLLRDLLLAAFAHNFLPGKGLPLPAGYELQERIAAAAAPQLTAARKSAQGDVALA